MDQDQITPNKKIARLAGFFYVMNVLLSIFYMQYVPSEIAVWGDAEATLGNFINNEMLFRGWLVSGIIVHVDFIVLPLLLYFLLSHVNKHVAIFMVVLALVSVPVSYGFMLDQFTLLDIYKNIGSMSLIEKEAASQQVLSLFDRLYDGFFLNQVYWGLWLFPFGYLSFKSGFLSKVLGVSLMLGCVTYLIDVVGGIMFQNYYDYINTNLLILPAAIGEIGSAIFLLTVGVKPNIKF